MFIPAESSSPGGASRALAPSTDTVDAADLAHLLSTDPLAVARLALGQVTPARLTSAARRNALVAMQSLTGALSALQGEVLVAECGQTRRVRQVQVVDEDSGADPNTLARRAGGELVEVGYDDEPVPGLRSITLADEVVDELAALLHRTPGSVMWELRQARLLHGPLAPVRHALADGAISARHAHVIADQAQRMLTAPLGAEAEAVFADKCTVLAERVLPTATRTTPQHTQAACRRLVVQIDAAGERERRQRAKSLCDVYARAEDDGMASITAILPALDAATAMGVVDATAKALAADPAFGEPGWTIGQYRAAAFTGLLTGANDTGAASGEVTSAGLPSTGPVARVEVQVLVDSRVLTGAAPDGAGFVVVGNGEHQPVDRDDVLALLADETTPTVLRRLLLDPATGAVIDLGARTYTPHADLVAWLTARDMTCRFPGCTTKAARCDVDHAQDFDAGGTTTVANTGLLCRRHHNRKTHAGWRIENSKPDGSCTFVAPDGRRHHHHATSLADLMVDVGVPPRPAPSTVPAYDNEPYDPIWDPAPF